MLSQMEKQVSIAQDTLRADIRALKAALEHSVVQLPSGRELRVSVSGGVAWYPESSTNLITLRKYADFAMYQVKRSRKGELLEFDPEVYRTSLQERRCHEEFRRLINEELVTYRFQPIIDAKDGSVFAYEALMRVDLPTLRSPMDVLRLAREENCLHESSASRSSVRQVHIRRLKTPVRSCPARCCSSIRLQASI